MTNNCFTDCLDVQLLNNNCFTDYLDNELLITNSLADCLDGELLINNSLADCLDSELSTNNSLTDCLDNELLKKNGALQIGFEFKSGVKMVIAQIIAQLEIRRDLHLGQKARDRRQNGTSREIHIMV